MISFAKLLKLKLCHVFRFKKKKIKKIDVLNLCYFNRSFKAALILKFFGIAPLC